MELSMQDRINFLQRYIIVHSYIYYELDNNIISDREYDARAKELVGYKKDYPELWRTSEYFKQFGDDYTGATGFNLYHELNEYQQGIIKSIVNCIFNSNKTNKK